MAWTTPRTWTTTELVTKSIMDTHVRDNLNAVHITQVTALPGSPFDGQLIVFTDSTTAPTYVWQLRYNANSVSSFKWEFIGGSTFRSAEADISFANQTSYVMTNSPAAILAPLAGDYDVIISGTAQRASGNISYWSYNVNSAGAADAIASIADASNAGALWFYQRQTLAASDSVRIAYKASNTGTNHFLDNARLELRPYRVG
jgi:hypothetical protein